MLRENFIIMKNLPNPFIGLCFLRRNNAIFDFTQGMLTFPFFSMQRKLDTQVTIRRATPMFAENTYTLQSGKTLAIASRIPHPIDHDANTHTTYTPIQQRLYNQITELEILNPHAEETSWKPFLSHFDYSNLCLPNACTMFEQIVLGILKLYERVT